MRLYYKNFYGSVAYSFDDKCFYGKIESINDLVNYEGIDVRKLKESFEEAVDDYMRICENIEKKVENV